MIKNRVLKLKQDVEVAKGMPLQSGQEIEIVMDVVYINGNMVPPDFQPLFLNFINKNPNLFTDDTRQW